MTRAVRRKPSSPGWVTASPPGVGVDDLLDSPHIFIATIDGFVDKFQGLRERFGISSIMVGEMDTLAPVVARLAGS